MIDVKRRGGTLFFLLATLAAVSISAAAAEAAGERWKAIPGKAGGERILYDADSVVPSGPNRYRVWIAGFDKDGFPRKSQEEFDCANRIVRDVEVVAERPGKPSTHTFTPSEWRDVPRETPRGELLKNLCR